MTREQAKGYVREINNLDTDFNATAVPLASNYDQWVVVVLVQDEVDEVLDTNDAAVEFVAEWTEMTEDEKDEAMR